MKKTNFLKIATLFLTGLSLSCGGRSVGGTETGNTVGAAVASLFSSEEQTIRENSIPLRIVSLLIREARAQQNGPTSACETRGPGESDIAISSSIASGTYGIADSPGDFVTLSTADGCDQGGDYAAFTVTSHTMLCTDRLNTSSRITMTQSVGVFRETGTASDIYGTFNLSANGGEASEVACHFTIAHGTTAEGTTQFSVVVCVDRSGERLDQATDTTCVNAE